jgi:hypothetical protein
MNILRWTEHARHGKFWRTFPVPAPRLRRDLRVARARRIGLGKECQVELADSYRLARSRRERAGIVVLRAAALEDPARDSRIDFGLQPFVEDVSQLLS